jgi:hypothetical protein
MSDFDGGRRQRSRTRTDERARGGRYDYDYAGSTGQFGQNEYGGDFYGGGRSGRGPYEQSQQFGGDDFEQGEGDFGSLQRQFENRTGAGGRQGSLGDRFGYQGPGDYSARPRRPGGFWHADHDGNEDSPQGPYRGAMGYGDRPGAEPYRARRSPERPRGPKGYQRSDERIHEDVHQQLERADHVDVEDVAVSVASGVVTLEGTVPERRMKHAIEDIVDGVHGVQDIENRIRVRRPGEGEPEARRADPGRPDDYSSAGS